MPTDHAAAAVSISQCLSVEFQQTGLELMFSWGEFMRKRHEDDVAKSGPWRLLL
jgi:hypothetical protein